MRAVVAASQHWMDGNAIREQLVELPVSTTVVVANRTGGDTLIARIAEEEMALSVEKIETDESTFKQVMRQEINEDADIVIVFCDDAKGAEYVIARHSRSAGIETKLVMS